MRITVIGRGRVGGGLARRWTAAGHDVTALGQSGGDATGAGADAAVVAIPGDAVEVGLAAVTGLDGQVTIDATNHFGDRPAGYGSVAAQVKAIVGGPTAQAFNTNFASLYDAVDAEPVPPGTLFASDPEARETTERLIRDAGFAPIHLGDLGQAPLLESLIALTMALDHGELGPFFYASTAPASCPRAQRRHDRRQRPQHQTSSRAPLLAAVTSGLPPARVAAASSPSATLWRAASSSTAAPGRSRHHSVGRDPTTFAASTTSIRASCRTGRAAVTASRSVDRRDRLSVPRSPCPYAAPFGPRARCSVCRRCGGCGSRGAMRRNGSAGRLKP